jgi:hypothetical protein
MSPGLAVEVLLASKSFSVLPSTSPTFHLLRRGQLALASIVYIETLFGANVKKFTCNEYAMSRNACFEQPPKPPRDLKRQNPGKTLTRFTNLTAQGKKILLRLTLKEVVC